MGDNTTTRTDKLNGLTNGEAKCPADHSQFPAYQEDRKAKSTECIYATSNGVPMPRTLADRSRQTTCRVVGLL